MNPWSFLNDPANTSNQSIFSDATIKGIKDFFVDNVFGRGPGRAFRVGAVPYGVLPAIALSRWVPAAGENTVVPETLRRLLTYWQAAAAKLPAVTRASSDRNLDLIKVLSQKASSDSVFVRSSIGVQTATNTLSLLAIEGGIVLDTQKRLQDPILNALAHTDWAPARILEVTFLGNAYRYKGPLVTAAAPVGGKLDDPNNYIKKLADLQLPLSQIENQDTMPEAGPQPRPLLFLLLRHALLLQAVAIGRRLDPVPFGKIGSLELEIYDINESPTTVFQVLSATEVDSGLSRFERIKQETEYKFYAQAIRNLQDVPIRDLERMFTEGLDSLRAPPRRLGHGSRDTPAAFQERRQLRQELLRRLRVGRGRPAHDARVAHRRRFQRAGPARQRRLHPRPVDAPRERGCDHAQRAYGGEERPDEVRHRAPLRAGPTRAPAVRWHAQRAAARRAARLRVRARVARPRGTGHGRVHPRPAQALPAGREQVGQRSLRPRRPHRRPQRRRRQAAARGGGAHRPGPAV